LTDRLPDALEDTIRSVRRLHVEHHSRSTRLQRALSRLTGLVGSPLFICALAVVVCAWIAGNALNPIFGYPPPDPPPFFWLQGAMTMLSLFMVAFIVGAQKHDDELGEQREMNTLELSLLNEQKIAKLIQLVEELRRDSPHVSDRVDKQAEAMAKPADSQSVFSAIREVRAAPGEPTSRPGASR
jgi:uncharacterized membrane protein